MAITAKLIRSTWLTREWRVTLLGKAHTVKYDGRGGGSEQVLVDGVCARRTKSWFWFVPRFEFQIEDTQARLDVRVNALLRVRACALKIKGTVVYSEGCI